MNPYIDSCRISGIKQVIDVAVFKLYETLNNRKYPCIQFLILKIEKNVKLIPLSPLTVLVLSTLNNITMKVYLNDLLPTLL